MPANVAKTVTVKDFKNGMNGLCHLKKIMFNVDFDFQGFYTLSGLLKSSVWNQRQQDLFGGVLFGRIRF